MLTSVRFRLRPFCCFPLHALGSNFGLTVSTHRALGVSGLQFTTVVLVQD